MSSAGVPTPRQVAVDLVQDHLMLHVDGTAGTGGAAPTPVHDPSTGAVLAEVATADAQDVETAVRAARRAHDRVWGRVPGVQRGQALLRLARGVRDRAEELAALESLGTGIPLCQTRERDVPAVLAHLVHHAGWADKLMHAGYGSGPDGTGPRALGVVAVLVPDTSSLVLAVRTLAAALAAGNAVVLVPAAASPLSALALARMAEEAELPPGVLTVLPGGPEVRAALAGHPGISSTTMAGSAAEAAVLQRQLAGRATRFTLELGGPATTLVLADADVARAADGLAASITAHHQLAGAGSRLIVHADRADALLAELRTRLARLRVGDALDPATEVGPLATAALRAATGELLNTGAGTLWRSPAPVPSEGWFLPPALLTRVAETAPAPAGPMFTAPAPAGPMFTAPAPAGPMFTAPAPAGPMFTAPAPAGPMLTVQVVDSQQAAAALIRAQPSGLGLGVWTADPGLPATLSRWLRRDVVHNGCPVPALGHGGGPASLEGYLDVR